MYFYNSTRNSVNLYDINKIIHFLDKEQYISSDDVFRSNVFQEYCKNRQFLITRINSDSIIERNLLLLQKNLTVEPNMLKKRIKTIYRGHVGGYVGYAKANRNMIYSLLRLGVDVCLDPLSKLDNLIISEKAWLERIINIPDPDSIMIHSVVPSFAEKLDAKYNILYTAVETGTVPQQFVDSCEMYDEIWVFSDFCKQVLSNAGVKKEIFVIPSGVDIRLYNENGSKHKFYPNLKEFVFVSVFGWNYRKGYDALLKSYVKFFSEKDPVTLLIVTSYQHDKNGKVVDYIGDEIKKFIRPFGPQIARAGYPIIEKDMPRMYRACNAFVLPTRGEGLCLPMLEASLCGLPIISTNYSGQMMFLNDNNSFLVPIDRMIQAKTDVHFWDSENMPALDSEDFINRLGNAMQYVYKNYSEALKRNKSLQDDILCKYSCDTVGQLAKQRLEHIWNQI